ncbi:hypothetical protein GCM10020220_023150 [Nonomuraea rubra]
MEVPNTTAASAVHVGGTIGLRRRGNLYPTTGDDTNPFESGGPTPGSTSAPRPQTRSSTRSATRANTNDLGAASC